LLRAAWATAAKANVYEIYFYAPEAILFCGAAPLIKFGGQELEKKTRRARVVCAWAEAN
jgi:hypothetical protein